MILNEIKMVVFDMSGTTIRDDNEVMLCFKKALTDMNIQRTDAELNTMMGWSKIEVFRSIWRQELENVELAEVRARRTNKIFRAYLEDYYANHDIAPTEGAVEVFDFLRKAGVRVVLNTGFYRQVVDILLKKLGWVEGETIDWTIASDEVLHGRPASDMIERAMQHFQIYNPKHVIKIGDTPSDLQEGREARCRFSFGVTNGTHTTAELSAYDNDGLLPSLSIFKQVLTGEIDLTHLKTPLINPPSSLQRSPVD
jgi:phosphonatase-like hydrolase